jgi:hypothetical protein
VSSVGGDGGQPRAAADFGHTANTVGRGNFVFLAGHKEGFDAGCYSWETWTGPVRSTFDEDAFESDIATGTFTQNGYVFAVDFFHDGVGCRGDCKEPLIILLEEIGYQW